MDCYSVLLMSFTVMGCLKNAFAKASFHMTYRNCWVKMEANDTTFVSGSRSAKHFHQLITLRSKKFHPHTHTHTHKKPLDSIWYRHVGFSSALNRASIFDAYLCTSFAALNGIATFFVKLAMKIA